MRPSRPSRSAVRSNLGELLVRSGYMHALGCLSWQGKFRPPTATLGLVDHRPVDWRAGDRTRCAGRGGGGIRAAV